MMLRYFVGFEFIFLNPSFRKRSRKKNVSKRILLHDCYIRLQQSEINNHGKTFCIKMLLYTT